MKRLGLVALALAICVAGRGEDFRKSFPPGDGSRFQLEAEGVTGDLVISVAKSQAGSVNIEYFFSAQVLASPVEMWQQVELSKPSSGGAVRVDAGYIQGRDMKVAERMPSNTLKGFDGLSLDSFLLNDQKDLAKLFVAKEAVTVPAGTIEATHYRQKQNGTTFDFWVSDEAKPIGIVKLESTGGKTGAFKVSLGSLVKNVAPKIDPTKAVALTDKGAAMLPSMPTARLP